MFHLTNDELRWFAAILFAVVVLGVLRSIHEKLRQISHQLEGLTDRLGPDPGRSS